MDLQYSTYVLYSVQYALLPMPFFCPGYKTRVRSKYCCTIQYTHYTVSRMQKLDPNEKLVFSCLETFTKGNFFPIYHRIKLSH